MVFQPVHQLACQLALFGAMGFGIPLGAIHVVDRDKSRLATLGQTHVIALQVGIDLGAEAVDRFPVGFRIRLGDARILMDAGDRHFMEKGDFGFVAGAADRSR